MKATAKKKDDANERQREKVKTYKCQNKKMIKSYLRIRIQNCKQKKIMKYF